MNTPAQLPGHSGEPDDDHRNPLWYIAAAMAGMFGTMALLLALG